VKCGADFERIVKHYDVYGNRISMDRLNYQTEEAKQSIYEFVFRKPHAQCGGIQKPILCSSVIGSIIRLEKLSDWIR